MFSISRFLLSFIVFYISFFSFANNQNKNSEVKSSEDINWGYLNPLRGDKSPGAADLWGDRTKNVATGMLVKFNKGFSSPPHIHNISYRGIVIDGLMHNDDPKAENMWLPTASFWTQPAGENHITAADGETNLIYLEIDSGPYLVKSQEQKFDNGERPINLHTSNLVWLKQNDSSFIDGENIAISYLWQNIKATNSAGYLIKLAKNAKYKISTTASEFRAVIIQGDVDYTSKETSQVKSLRSSSYFSSSDTFVHNIKTAKETIIYVRSNGEFNFVSERLIK
ncbi:DUF4437 domain-containing protein [Thalassotalea sp. SU-HH00458]|uniref:DUF4437 domain-containing protein n=1 Tax=Thalassotalea sp. SU-HH00458 TaxID=3127657 RepID=UPI00310318A8